MKIEFLDMIFEVCLVDLKADFFLAKFLLGKGYQVHGTYRRNSSENTWRLNYLDILLRVGYGLPMSLQLR